MKEDQKTTHKNHQDQDQADMKKEYPTRDHIETTMIKTDRKTITMKKDQAEKEEEGIQEQTGLEPMATEVERHENTARRFHAWGNLL